MSFPLSCDVLLAPVLPHGGLMPDTRDIGAPVAPDAGNPPEGCGKPAPYEERTKTSLRFDPHSPPSMVEGPDDGQADEVANVVAQIGAELGDTAPRSSRTRAEGLRRRHELDAGAFLDLADQAARVVRRRQRKGGPLRRPMAYWFDVLGALLADATTARAEVRTPASAGTAPHERAAETPAAGAIPSETPDRDETPDETPAASLWREVIGELGQVMTAENVQRWFGTTQAALADDVLQVTAPSAFDREWLERRLRRHVERALERVKGGMGLSVRFSC